MNSSPASPLDARIARLEAELARQREIEARNDAKAYSLETPARSRFANAAHATKARLRAAGIEADLDRLRPAAPVRALSIVEGAYRLGRPVSPTRWTAYVRFGGSGLDVDADDPTASVEEIDVDADSYDDAWRTAELALARDFEPGGAIAAVEERLGLYL